MKRVLIALMLATVCRAQDAASWYGMLADTQGGTWYDGLGLTSVWPLESDAVDKIGDYDGTWSGTETYSETNGVTGAYLNGASYIDFGDNFDIPNGEHVAWGGWFKLPSSGQYAGDVGIIGKGETFSGGAGNYGIFLNASTNVKTVIFTPTQSTASNLGANRDQWIFISAVIRRDDGSVKTTSCIDGVLNTASAAIASSVDFNTDRPFTIGRNPAYAQRLKGHASNCFVKRGGGTNDLVTIYNSTKSIYGK